MFYKFWSTHNYTNEVKGSISNYLRKKRILALGESVKLKFHCQFVLSSFRTMRWFCQEWILWVSVVYHGENGVQKSSPALIHC